MPKIYVNIEYFSKTETELTDDSLTIKDSSSVDNKAISEGMDVMTKDVQTIHSPK